MRVSDKGARIFKSLAAHNNAPLTVESLSRMTGISDRSVRTYLKEVFEFCRAQNIPFVNKPGVGVYLQSPLDRAALNRLMEEDQEQFADESSRVAYMIGTLLDSWDHYTISMFQEELFIGKALANKVLDQADKWLEGYGLVLVRKPGQGLAITGSEEMIRNAFVAIRRTGARAEHPEMPIPADLDYRISPEQMDELQKAYRHVDIRKLQRILQQTDEWMGVQLTDASFLMLIEYAAAMLSRIRKGSNASDLDLPRPELERPEYAAARRLAEALRREWPYRLLPQETAYLSMCLRGCDIQYDDDAPPAAEIPEEVRTLARDVVRLISYLLGQQMESDETLHRDMAIHLDRAMVRVRNGLSFRNPMTAEVRRLYGSVFSACWAANPMLSERGKLFPEDEIAQLALIIVNALERRQHIVDAFVVCAGGIGTSQLVARRIADRVPEIRILDILPWSARIGEQLDKADLVITTIPSFRHGARTVHVSNHVDDADVARLKEACRAIRSPEGTGASGSGLIDILREDLSFLHADFRSKDELIAAGVGRLREFGCVEAGFLEDVLAREALAPTAVGNGVAIPHGVRGLVKSPGVGLVTLKKPIDWGGEMVDTVFLLALNFSDVENTKAFFRGFHDITSDRDTVRDIHKARSFAEVRQKLLQKGFRQPWSH